MSQLIVTNILMAVKPSSLGVTHDGHHLVIKQHPQHVLFATSHTAPEEREIHDSLLFGALEIMKPFIFAVFAFITGSENQSAEFKWHNSFNR